MGNSQNTKATNVSCNSSRSSNTPKQRSNSSEEPFKPVIQFYQAFPQTSKTSAELYKTSLSASVKPPQYTKVTNVSNSSSRSSNILGQRSNSSEHPVKPSVQLHKTSVQTSNPSVQSVTTLGRSSNTSAQLHNASLSASVKPPQHTKATNVSYSFSRSSNTPEQRNSSEQSFKPSVQLPKTSLQTSNPSVQSVTTLRRSSNTLAQSHNASLSVSDKPPQHTKASNVSYSFSRSSNTPEQRNSSEQSFKPSVQLPKTSLQTSNPSVQSVTTLRRSSNTLAQSHNASLSASVKQPQHTKATNVSYSSSKSSNTPGQGFNSSEQSFKPSVQLQKTSVQTSNPSVPSLTTLRQSFDTSAQSHNASVFESVKPPPSFTSEEEFVRDWSTWKSDFLIYKKISDINKPGNVKWGDRLRNVMGPNGQKICNVFTFNSLNDKNDLDILLKKFDEYHTFASTEKLPDEDTYKYIRHLQLTVSKANFKDEEGLIRNKILKEIDERTFTNAAKVPMPWFKFSSDFNNLTLKEIAFIWKLYDGNFTEDCDSCGNNHNDERCPSLGKQCFKCNEFNHFPKRCPTVFITDCHYCGDSHLKKKCPSYNETCTKCNKLNHFSWKCQSQISSCHFCGLTHGASRSLCPAKNTLCSTCKTKGHFAGKCKNSSSRNH
ncbi:uncharacterized protein LOC114874419 [Osmia bicornis bicornis]|uniref:uncharacterized protein LOC114874419 n=1 Tax=Osmia bicornis bicornis TaxID=1437191 RepID=UPI001EAEC48E|nr:uncharacterized protein LOC114874419 [Osmia bicornis bicornis]